MNSVVSVASLASASAVALPSIEATPVDDPIFAAIERHRAFCKAINNSPVEDDDLDDACDAEQELYYNLRRHGAPLSCAGWAALLRYVTEYESDIGDVTEQLQEFCARLADALERMVAQS